MSHLKSILFGACLISLGYQLQAQTPGAIQQVESDQQRRRLERDARSVEPGENVPEIFPGEVSDTGPQSVLRSKPRRTYVEAMADAQFFYTDNMFLDDDDDEQETDVLVGTAQLALAPTPYDLGSGKFAPRVGYRHQWFLYGLANDDKLTVFDFQTATTREADLDEFDFNAQTVFTDGRWTRGPWAFEAGFEFTRLMDSDDYNEFYQEYVPRWGVQRLFSLTPTTTFSLGYAGDYRFTDTELPPPNFEDDFNSRTDHSLFVALTQSICKQAVVQPYYRFKYTRFTEGDERDDYLHSFGLALHCFFTQRLSVRAFLGYDILETSNANIPEYKRLDAGGGLNLTLRF